MRLYHSNCTLHVVKAYWLLVCLALDLTHVYHAVTQTLKRPTVAYLMSFVLNTVMAHIHTCNMSSA